MTTHCSAVLRSSQDFGRRFDPEPSPPTTVMVNPESGLSGAVSTVQFANSRDGWLYGPGLWSTHDGGRSWHAVRLHEQVFRLATGAGYVWLVTGACSSDNGCPSFSLRRSPDHLDHFKTVNTPEPLVGPASAPSLAVDDRTVAVMADTQTASAHYLHQSILTSTDAGTTWSSRPGPCDSDLGGQLTVTRTADWVSCATGMMAFVAVAPPNGTFHDPAQRISLANSAIVASHGDSTLVGAVGPVLHRTTDRGQHWANADVPTGLGSGNWTEFAFANSSVSFALYTRPLSALLLMSNDETRSWHVISPL